MPQGAVLREMKKGTCVISGCLSPGVLGQVSGEHLELAMVVLDACVRTSGQGSDSTRVRRAEVSGSFWENSLSSNISVVTLLSHPTRQGSVLSTDHLST